LSDDKNVSDKSCLVLKNASKDAYLLGRLLYNFNCLLKTIVVNRH